MFTVIDNFPLKAHNTFGMDVMASRWIDYDSADSIPEVIENIKGDKFRCIGAGSNMLFMGDYSGTLLHSSILDIEMQCDSKGGYRFHIGSGVDFDSFIKQTTNAGIWGLENLSGIPGDAGSAAVQNIGAYGVEVSDFIESVECYDILNREYISLPREECRYAYRYSVFKEPENRKRFIVTYVNLVLPANGSPKVKYGNLAGCLEKYKSISPAIVRNEILRMRDSKLPNPQKTGSAGSFFKNPVMEISEFKRIEKIAAELWGNETKVPHFETDNKIKVPAAWLIEKCGWKGKNSGSAGCWHLQPLVLVNLDGKATPDEILDLENKIINSVEITFGIHLEPEVDHLA